jgi:glucose-6-phosphate 1-dehydrogenase
VPFFIRAGKRMPVTTTEVLASLRHPPQKVFDEPIPPKSNYLRFRLGPEQVSIALGARVKHRGARMVGEEIELFVCNVQDDEMEAYERLIGDAMRGDTTLFSRQDAVEAAWRIVDPIIGMKTPVHAYEPGSWGPREADAMIASVGSWHDPSDQP